MTRSIFTTVNTLGCLVSAAFFTFRSKRSLVTDYSLHSKELFTLKHTDTHTGQPRQTAPWPWRVGAAVCVTTSSPSRASPPRFALHFLSKQITASPRNASANVFFFSSFDKMRWDERSQEPILENSVPPSACPPTSRKCHNSVLCVCARGVSSGGLEPAWRVSELGRRWRRPHVSATAAAAGGGGENVFVFFFSLAREGGREGAKVCH